MDTLRRTVSHFSARAVLAAAGLCLAPILAVPAAAQAGTEAEQAASHRPRIGLVLGGGGARGAAHVGVLE
ncbi:MAG TPA: hypothetical protein PK420_00115, partial [Rubrivivax sp.]|nr:hypothetical protein [Rubrivivax sp.]